MVSPENDIPNLQLPIAHIIRQALDDLPVEQKIEILEGPPRKNSFPIRLTYTSSHWKMYGNLKQNYLYKSKFK